MSRIRPRSERYEHGKANNTFRSLRARLPKPHEGPLRNFDGKLNLSISLIQMMFLKISVVLRMMDMIPEVRGLLEDSRLRSTSGPG